jgi:hypothetical protein
MDSPANVHKSELQWELVGHTMDKTNRETSSLFTRKSGREHTAPQCCYTVYLRARLWLLHHQPSDLTSYTHTHTHTVSMQRSIYREEGGMVGSDLITHVPPGPRSLPPVPFPSSVLRCMEHQQPN